MELLKPVKIFLATISFTFITSLHAQETTSSIAITSAATNYQQSGRFIWADLTTHDAARAVDFYSQLFGWQIVAVDDRYSMAYINKQPVAGIAQLATTTKENTQWLGFISAKDPEKLAEHASANGGAILLEPKSISGRGNLTVLADNEGAIFGVLKSEFGEPLDHVAGYNEWIWQELWADNPEAAANFYSKAGYEVINNDASEAENDLILVAGDFARAGIIQKTDASIKSNWLLYLRVEDLKSIEAKVLDLGGELLSMTNETQSSFPVGIFADNTGGIFAAVEWQPSEEKSE